MAAQPAVTQAAPPDEYRRRTPDIVSEMMREYGNLTRKALLDFLPDREPRRYLYDPMRDYPTRTSRGMQSAICIAAARAHGAPTERALPCAVSVELLHNALLVVDDIQDGSTERRGRATLHELHGMPIALNVGATTSILSLVPLLRNVDTAGPQVALWIFERAIEVAQQTAEGQAMELGWRLDNRVDVSAAEYLDMVLRKTCGYSIIFPLRAGTMIAKRTPEVPESLLRYGFLLGAAFQIQDDLLNLVGDHARYGKELQGDLLEGKRTLMTIRLLDVCSAAERTFFTSFLEKERGAKTAAEVERVAALLRHYACYEHARSVAQALVGAAQHEFSRDLEHLPASRDKEFLRSLSTWMIEQ